jgi:hypothetical protein
MINTSPNFERCELSNIKGIITINNYNINNNDSNSSTQQQQRQQQQPQQQ